MVGLTACSKSKQGEHNPNREYPAQELYDSWLFDSRTAALETHCDVWGVFSAKHGYLAPDDEVSYYDLRIDELSETEKRELAREVVDEMPDGDRLMILMGRGYADPLIEALPDEVDVWDPLEGIGLFNQRSELKELAHESTQATL